jgi:hypothetical protein
MFNLYKKTTVFGILLIAVLTVSLSNLGKIQYWVMIQMAHLYSPTAHFDVRNMSEKPNYEDANAWLSLPEFIDESDIAPKGVTSINNGQAPVDVFYIHGTTYSDNHSWTSPYVYNATTENNARFALANEASIFNTCCNIFSPRYRQANIFTYLTASPDTQQLILNSVYQDVKDAFDVFIRKLNKDRPFIIVSHSQGTHHAMQLLADLQMRTDVTERLIVAYMIGSYVRPLTQSFINNISYLDTCNNKDDIKCIVHWDTFGENGGQMIFPILEESICVNPLTWNISHLKAKEQLHLGAASVSGSFLMGGTGFGETSAFTAPVITKRYTSAQCREGVLYVDDPSGTYYSKLGSMSDHSMHGVNFQIFHMNIRVNVQQRIQAFLISANTE